VPSPVAGMNASQVWGTVYLSEGSKFGSQVQKRHLRSLRRILGVKNSTTNWAVLACWSAQISNAFNGLQGSAMFKQKMLRATQVPMQ
jgi:autotransporter adhesin